VGLLILESKLLDMVQMYKLNSYFCQMENPFNDTYFMKKALQEAEMAFEKDEIPVGALIVINNTVIARTHNLTELLHDVTAHAEMQAITSAANFLGGKYLKDCTLYVTLEPCQMCAGALYWSQISKIVYGATDEQRGFVTMGTQLHPKTEVVSGILAEDAAELMKRFFVERRK
jgi:tRNA(adenine34) deaminase